MRWGKTKITTGAIGFIVAIICSMIVGVIILADEVGIINIPTMHVDMSDTKHDQDNSRKHQR